MGSKLALVLLLVLCCSTRNIHAVPVDSSESTVVVNATSTEETPMKNEILVVDTSNHTIANETDIGVDNSTSPKSIRRGRVLNLDFPPVGDVVIKPSKFRPIQSRILTGGQTSLTDLSSNTFQDTKYSKYSSGSSNMDVVSHHQSPFYGNVNKYDAMLIGHPPAAPVKTMPPADRFSTVSYSNPASYSGQGGIEPSDLIPYYQNPHNQQQSRPSHVLYQLVPVKPQAPQEPTLSDHVKDTLFKMKDHVSGTMQKVKNVLGFNGFAEKVASPDVLAVAPVAAGLLAGGLAVAYFAARQGAGARNGSSFSPPFSIFGKRSVRDVISEEDLNHIVSRLDPVQREYLQKLQFYGPQRWKDVTCAKYIFCDVMSKATPIHVLDMQRKIGIFLSRMDESTARYVEVILKDVMLAIQARDCSRFSCGQTSWGHLPPRPPAPPPPLPPQFVGHPHLQLFPGHNFLRRQ